MGDRLELKRGIGIWGAVAIVTGGIIGSGIFISPTGIAQSMGSVGGSLIIWLACGIVALLMSHIYAELGAYLPNAGGDYAYEKEGLGKPVAFLYVWTAMTCRRPSATAAQVLVAAEYLLAVFYGNDGCGPAPKYMIVMLAVAIILLIGAVNSYSVGVTKNIGIVTTIAKLSTLLIIIIGGMINLINGKTEYLDVKSSFEGTSTNLGDIAVAFYNGLWAYSGWYLVGLVATEIENPGRTIPLALGISLPLVIIVYMLANISYFTVMDIDALLSSFTVAVTWAEATIPGYEWYISLSVAISSAGAAFGGMLTSTRIGYAAAKDNMWWGPLSMISVNYLTPLPSVLYLTILAAVFAIPSDIRSIINFLGFTEWLFYFFSTLSLVILRLKRPHDKRIYKIPLVIPIFMLFVAGFLIFFPVIFTEDRLPYLWASCFVVGGLIVYIPFIYYAVKIPGLDKAAVGIQLFLNVAPGDNELEQRGKPIDKVSESSNL